VLRLLDGPEPERKGMMARYYGSMKGGRGEVTRTGTPSSGITSHPRGWNIGVKVEGYPSVGDSTRDEFDVTLTGGSHDGAAYVPLVVVRETLDGNRMVRHFTPDGEILAEYVVNAYRTIVEPV
jgi:hypothetical protein